MFMTTSIHGNDFVESYNATIFSFLQPNKYLRVDQVLRRSLATKRRVNYSYWQFGLVLSQGSKEEFAEDFLLLTSFYWVQYNSNRTRNIRKTIKSHFSAISFRQATFLHSQFQGFKMGLKTKTKKRQITNTRTDMLMNNLRESRFILSELLDKS